MTPEQEALLNELMASDASYAQAKEVIQSMEGLSDSEKREALLSFAESDWALWRKLQNTKDSLDKPKITNLINLASKINREETMPIQMTCPACGKKLSAPDTAAGKKAKCPSCREIILIPEAVQESQGFYPSALQPSAPSDPQPPSGSSDNWLDQLQGPPPVPTAVPPPVPTASGGERRRPCPACGQLIAAGAPECRFCGTVFDSRLGGTTMRRGKSYQGFAVTSMILGIVSIVGTLPFCCFPLVGVIGLVSGISAIIFAVVASNGMKTSGNFDGKGMATTGLILGIISVVLCAVFIILLFIGLVGLFGLKEAGRSL